MRGRAPGQKDVRLPGRPGMPDDPQTTAGGGASAARASEPGLHNDVQGLTLKEDTPVGAAGQV